MPPPISPTITMASVPASLSSASSASRVVVPSIGSPPMPMKADWPRPARVRLRQTSVPRLPLREITPTRPGLNTLGTKAGMMPTKHSPGVTRPAVLGPTMRVPCLRGGGMHRHHVLRRNVLGQHHQQLDAGLGRRHGGLLAPSAAG